MLGMNRLCPPRPVRSIMVRPARICFALARKQQRRAFHAALCQRQPIPIITEASKYMDNTGPHPRQRACASGATVLVPMNRPAAVVSSSRSFTYRQLLRESASFAKELSNGVGDMAEARVAFLANGEYEYVVGAHSLLNPSDRRSGCRQIARCWRANLQPGGGASRGRVEPILAAFCHPWSSRPSVGRAAF